MPEINLTQAEADALIAMEKHRVDNKHWPYPSTGESLAIPLVSTDKKESFFLDINRGRINVSRITFQNRARQVVVLLRLDIDGPAHPNPDGQEIPCPHLHIYREDFGDKWAVPVPSGDFKNPGDRSQTLEDFMRYCNIVDPPNIQRGLF